MADPFAPPPAAALLKGYATSVALVQLGKLIQLGIVDKHTDLKTVTNLLNEKLIKLELPLLDLGETVNFCFALKGLGLFQREGKNPSIV